MTDVADTPAEPPWDDPAEPPLRALRWRFIVALIAAGAVAFVASGLGRPAGSVGGAGIASAAPASPRPAGAAALTGAVPIAVVGPFDQSPGAAPTVAIRIDNGPPLRVVLDTGSSGLWIRAGSLPPGLPTLATGQESGWGDGNVTHESITSGILGIGGVTTTHAIPIAVVHSTSCLAIIACPPWAESGGTVGILGISPLGNGIAPSPLLSLPSPYDSTWQISLHGRGGVLRLGAPDPARPVAEFHVPTQFTGVSSALEPVRSAAPPSPEMAIAPPTCWRFGRGAAPTCVPTMFDTGSAQTWAGTGSELGATGGHLLAPGTRVSVSAAPGSRPFWSFTAGTVMSRNVVSVPAGAKGYMVAGIPVFYAFTVGFDVAGDAMTLSKPTAH